MPMQHIQLGSRQSVKIAQDSAASVFVAKVSSGNPSDILGTLNSNGRVVLINSGGIAFQAGSQVNTAGLVASTLTLSDSDLKNGRFNFVAAPGAGDITNAGNIESTGGGRIYLIAPNITNSGTIRNDGGQISRVADERAVRGFRLVVAAGR